MDGLTMGPSQELWNLDEHLASSQPYPMYRNTISLQIYSPLDETKGGMNATPARLSGWLNHRRPNVNGVVTTWWLVRTEATSGA